MSGLVFEIPLLNRSTHSTVHMIRQILAQESEHSPSLFRISSEVYGFGREDAVPVQSANQLISEMAKVGSSESRAFGLFEDQDGFAPADNLFRPQKRRPLVPFDIKQQAVFWDSIIQ